MYSLWRVFNNNNTITLFFQSDAVAILFEGSVYCKLIVVYYKQALPWQCANNYRIGGGQSLLALRF